MADIPEDIIEGCRKGKPESQEKLYQLVAPGMYAVCLQYASDEDEAKDIMQDGFIKVFRKMDQYRGTGSLEGWIRRIIVNTALEKLRKSRHLGKLEEHEGDDSLTEEPDVYGELEAEELLELIRELSPRYRAVFNLYAIEGYTHQEISEMLSISEGTSKSNLSRARTLLQSRIQEKYSEKSKTD